MVLNQLGNIERRPEYFDRAIIEFTAAIYHYEEGGHERYAAATENNLATSSADSGDMRKRMTTSTTPAASSRDFRTKGCAPEWTRHGRGFS